MERLRISLFIFSTIALLGVLCTVFPEEGVRIAGSTLRFPTLSEVLEKPEEAPVPSAVQSGKEDGPRDHFSFPGGDSSYFDAFFEELAGAYAKRVNIVHYGDSQIEEDRISSSLRDRLQTRFGGGGTGILPAATYYTVRESVSASAELTSFLVFGPEETKAGNNSYGPRGQFVRLDSTVTVSFRPARKSSQPSRFFNRLTVYGSGSLAISCKGRTQKTISAAVINCNSFELPDSSINASVTISGAGDIYGISLFNDRGVSVDNIPMRACSGTVFTAINRLQLEEYFKDSGTAMVILQYGGNGVPYLKTGKAISEYCDMLERQIQRVKSVAPQAAILFIGPSDMATSVNGKRQTYPHLSEFVDSLKAGVTASGAAYWDMFSAMGGEGSMVGWVKGQPALAGPDYIHFTVAGAEKMGGMLADELIERYDIYNRKQDD